jgi:hypothetical protein
MFRLVRFLIITFTLGRIRWLMRLTWLWRLIVFLGLTGWLSRKIRQTIGLDKKASTDVDSAWADALRYTPQPAAAGASASAAAGTAAGAAYRAAPSAAPTPAAPEDELISESTSEVTATTADGATETITIHEVSAEGDTESIVRIEDEAGNVETLVTGAPVEDIDLANLGEPAGDVIEIDEIVVEEQESVDRIAPDIESEAELEVEELIETLEAAEPEVPEPIAASEPPKRKRRAKAEAKPVAEPIEETDEDPDFDLIADPDWVRGDGSHDCPDSHPVKAKASSMIYYVPESGHYDLTIPDVCFASDLDAASAGYRAPRR